MQIQSFVKWLKSIKKYSKGTVNSRVSNCKRIEEFYGDLDENYKNDKLEGVRTELNSDKHKIPINGDYYTGTATLKSALKLYLEFKENDLLDSIMNSPDLDPNIHDGSYELVKETLESISKVELSNLGIEDLDMIYGMSLGSWRLGIYPRNTRIDSSNLSNEEKKRLKSVLSRIVEKAEKKGYQNIEGEDWSIGMFGTGFLSFNGKSTEEDAKKFLSLLIKIKDLSSEEEIFDILEEGFKNGISGIQAGSASMMLHCLKPRIFPILNGAVAESIVILEGMDVVLNKANQLTHYIENTRIIKAFRDKYCKFKNYRVLDMKLWDAKVLVDRVDNGDENLNLSEERLKSIIDAFKSIGGKGKVEDVFDIIKEDSRFHYERFLNKSSAEGSIRLIIQEHSSDTETYKDTNKDLFYSVNGIGKGRWGLRNINSSLNLDFSQPLSFDDLYFSNPEVLKSQISIALKSGKSIILIGPPGTGKSKLAKKIAKSYKADSKMVTAMSDWSSYDTIGGYKPNVDGSLYFEEGIFLSSFKSKDGTNKNKWLIIDEINRADIDKSFGPFFSALSSDDVELGLKDSNNRNIEILLEENLKESIDVFKADKNKYIIPKDWRIIGTMNTFDKTSLYEMSYAFMRRFAFIPIAIPNNINREIVSGFFKLWGNDIDLNECENLANLWKVINKYRKIGPAIIEDIGNFIIHGGDYTSAVVIYILPQLEGLFAEQISLFLEDLKALSFIKDVERLIESIEDFFNINLIGK